MMSAAPSAPSGDAEATHLVVLVHGHNGAPSNLEFFERVLKLHFAKHAPRTFIVLNSQANAGMTPKAPPVWSWFVPFFTPLIEGKTHQGIHVGGARLAIEVEQHLLAHPAIARVSFIGHSLGGVYARYALGVLASHGWLPGVECAQPRAGVRRIQGAHFITLASPHLGSLQVGRGVPAFGLLTAAVNTTVEQLLLRDKKHPSDDALERDLVARPPSAAASVAPSAGQSAEDETLPLMLQLARAPFVNVLAAFEQRLVFANARNDHIVAFCTAAVCARNPMRAVGFDACALERYRLAGGGARGYRSLVDVNAMLGEGAVSSAPAEHAEMAAAIGASIAEAAEQAPSSSSSSSSSGEAADDAQPSALPPASDADDAHDAPQPPRDAWPPAFRESGVLRDMHARLAGVPAPLPPHLGNAWRARVAGDVARVDSTVAAITVGVMAVAAPPLLVPTVAASAGEASAVQHDSAQSSLSSSSPQSPPPPPLTWQRVGVLDRPLTAHFDICMLNGVVSAGSSGEEVVQHICLEFWRAEEERRRGNSTLRAAVASESALLA